MANLSQQINTLQEQVMEKIQTISTRAQTINRDIGVVNQNVQRAFEELAGFQDRIAAIVDRIKQLKGRGSDALKREFLGKLTNINRELDAALTNLPEDLTGPINQMPQTVGRQVNDIQAGLHAIEQELTSAEQGGPGGPDGGGDQEPGGGGGRAPLPPPALRQGDLGGVDKRGNPNPFVLSEQGRRAAALDRGQAAASQQDAALLERLPGIENIPGPRQGGGKKRRKTKRKGRKGRKARKSRRGGYVIPKKRVHSSKRKTTPAAGKKTKSKK